MVLTRKHKLIFVPCFVLIGSSLRAHRLPEVRREFGPFIEPKVAILPDFQTF